MSAAPYQEPVVSTMEMEDYIKMQETTQPSADSCLARTVSPTSPTTPAFVRCCSETDITMERQAVAAVGQGQLPLSFGVANHSVENIYEHIQ